MRAQETDAIPDDFLEALARRLYPSLIAFFESDEGRREFAEWQSRRDVEGSPGVEAWPEEEFRLAG